MVADLREGTNIAQGVTPQIISLDSGAGYFKKARYEIRVMRDDVVVNRVPVEVSMDGWYIGNVLFGGLIGILIVDPLTGAMYKLPDTINLSGDGMAQLTVEDSTLTLVSLTGIPESHRSELIPLAAR